MTGRDLIQKIANSKLMGKLESVLLDTDMKMPNIKRTKKETPPTEE